MRRELSIEFVGVAIIVINNLDKKRQCYSMISTLQFIFIDRYIVYWYRFGNSVHPIVH